VEVIGYIIARFEKGMDVWGFELGSFLGSMQLLLHVLIALEYPCLQEFW